MKADDKIHKETVVDNERFVYVDAWAEGNNVRVHIKISNGWRVDPWHVLVTIEFVRGMRSLPPPSNGIMELPVDRAELPYIVHTMNVHAWAAATRGAHAIEANYDYTLSIAGLWDNTDDLEVSGRNEPKKRRGRPLFKAHESDERRRGHPSSRAS